jgi:hypothetical protein
MDAGQSLSHAKAEVSAPQVCVTSQCTVNYADVQATHHADGGPYTVHLQCGDSSDGSTEQIVTVKVNDSILATWKFKPGEEPMLQDGITADMQSQQTDEDDLDSITERISKYYLPYDTPFKRFEDLHQSLHQPLHDLKISTLSASQSIMIGAPRGGALVLAGEHGSGKTFGALISGLESIQQEDGEVIRSDPGEPFKPYILIVAPTNEDVVDLYDATADILNANTALDGKGTLTVIRVGRLTSQGCDGCKFMTHWSSQVVICTPGELTIKLSRGEISLERCRLLVYERLETLIRSDETMYGMQQTIQDLAEEITKQIETSAEKPAVLGVATVNYASLPTAEVLNSGLFSFCTSGCKVIDMAKNCPIFRHTTSSHLLLDCSEDYTPRHGVNMASTPDDKKAKVWKSIVDYREFYADTGDMGPPQFVMCCGNIPEARELVRYLIEERQMKIDTVRLAWGDISMRQYDGKFRTFRLGDPGVEVLVYTDQYIVRSNLVYQPVSIYYSSGSYCEKSNLLNWCKATIHAANSGHIWRSLTLIDFRLKDDCKLANAVVKLFPAVFGLPLSVNQVDTAAVKAKAKALEVNGLLV